jgi:hypothetical protein
MANPLAIGDEPAIVNDPATAKQHPVPVEFVTELHANGWEAPFASQEAPRN